MEAAVLRVEHIVDVSLKGLYRAENVVAVGMPWVAEIKAIHVAESHRPTVHGGLMVSISLVPGQALARAGEFFGGGDDDDGDEGEDRVICADGWMSSCSCDRADKRGCCSHHQGLATTLGGEALCRIKSTAPAKKQGEREKKRQNAGIRWGLPVEDDDYAALCAHAGEYLTDFVFMPFERFSFLSGGILDGIKAYTKGLVDGLVSNFPGYFCGDEADAAKSIGDLVKNALGQDDRDVKDSAKKACRKRKDQVDQHNASLAQGEQPQVFDEAKCRASIEKGYASSTKKSTVGGDKTSKKVYSEATAGDRYFQSWSLVFGDLGTQSSARKGVEIAAWNKTRAREPGLMSKVHFAASEFYYEPRASGDDRTWPGLAGEAMWNMRWRARLRRIHTPDIGGFLAGKLQGLLDEKVRPHLSGGGHVAEAAMDLLSRTIADAGKSLEDEIDDVVPVVIH
jgi:hypothetical protein